MDLPQQLAADVVRVGGLGHLRDRRRARLLGTHRLDGDRGECGTDPVAAVVVPMGGDASARIGLRHETLGRRIVCVRRDDARRRNTGTGRRRLGHLNEVAMVARIRIVVAVQPLGRVTGGQRLGNEF